MSLPDKCNNCKTYEECYDNKNMYDKCNAEDKEFCSNCMKYVLPSEIDTCSICSSPRLTEEEVENL